MIGNKDLSECYVDEDLVDAYDGSRPDPRRRRVWMGREGVTESKAHCCLGKVVHGRGWSCAGWYGKCSVCRKYEKRDSDWFDHVELFWDPEALEYVFTSQPYDVTRVTFQEMQEFAEGHGMSVAISVEDAWWSPGQTPLIVWRKAEHD